MLALPLLVIEAAAAAAAPSFDLMAVIGYYNGWDYIFGLTLIVAFLDAYGIGANDVANSFATSVGSGSLTLKQAVMIAVCTEFLGAVLVGKTTSDTVRNKIVNLSQFYGKPSLLMLGMFCALTGSSIYVLIATRLGLPVSTTHSIVGAIMGVGIAAFGTNGVVWDYNSGGFASIVASWFISPTMAGVLAAFLWLVTEYAVLRHDNAFQRTMYTIPFYTFATVTFIVFFMSYKGIPRVDTEKTVGGVGAVAGMSLGIGAGVAIIATFTYLPWIKRRTEAEFARREAAKLAINSASTLVVRPGGTNGDDESKQDYTEAEKALNNGSGPMDPASPSNASSLALTKSPITSTQADLHKAGTGKGEKAWADMSAMERAKFVALRGIEMDVVSHPELAEMHAKSRKFDERSEILYSFLQILTASFASFAHGSNDIANACGPLATVYAVYSSTDYQYDVAANKSNEVPIWVLAFCAIALDIGLTTYGYNIMRELGNKITYHSPARGFIMELSAGVAVLFASKQGWPISTTHCITGATIAVGLASGDASSVNWKRALAYLSAWIVTVPLAGLVAGLFFSLLAFAPKAYELNTTL